MIYAKNLTISVSLGILTLLLNARDARGSSITADNKTITENIIEIL